MEKRGAFETIQVEHFICYFVAGVVGSAMHKDHNMHKRPGLFRWEHQYKQKNGNGI
jgi:hypothetical protein